MDAHAAQCRHLLGRSHSILAGLNDSHRAVEPKPGTKTAGWLIGHLAVTGDFARRLCGRAPLCPPQWAAAFYPGTVPSTTASDYPPMESLRATFRSVYEDLCLTVCDVPADRLGAPNPYEPARGGFPTAGSFVAYLLTGHLGYHLGQLVAWRAAAGLEPIGRSTTEGPRDERGEGVASRPPR